MKIYITDIEWDTSDDGRSPEELGLPSEDAFETDGLEEEFTKDDVEGFIEDYLSDVYGWTFFSYNYRVED